MEHIDNNNLVKIGLVVDDLERTARTFCELFGMEMPAVQVPDPDAAPEPTDDNYTWYRGEYRPTRTKFANLQMGPVTLELLEPYDEPSPWNEFRQKHGQGVHFIAFTVGGFNRHLDLLEKFGMPTTHKGEYGAGRYAYVESEDRLGVTLGVQELGPRQD
jgi:catechol 2,3-dioxygenase-like lactoylglutathione lyase family enzyme